MSSKITLNRQRHKGAWLNRIQKEVEKVWPPPLSLIDIICSIVTLFWTVITFSVLLSVLERGGGGAFYVHYVIFFGEPVN